MSLDIEVSLPNVSEIRIPILRDFEKWFFLCLNLSSVGLIWSFQNSTAAESNVINCFGHFISNCSQDLLLI